LRLNAGKPVTLDLHAGRNTALVILRGTVRVNGEDVARPGQLALFERDGSQLTLESAMTPRCCCSVANPSMNRSWAMGHL
jgi:redox-sensitive bicupin YhaK (pirin superfamily)